MHVRVQEVLSELKYGIRKKDHKRIEGIFSAHLKNIHNSEIWLLYLNYVEEKETNREVVKEAISFAYQKTLYSVDSVDVKIKYLQMLMNNESKETVKLAYEKIISIPIMKIETIIDFYKNFNLDIKDSKKFNEDLIPKEAVGISESNKLLKISQLGAFKVSEYILEANRNLHPMYSDNVVIYGIDYGIEKEEENDLINQLVIYKVIFLSSSDHSISLENMIDPHTRLIASAKGKSEKLVQLGEYVYDRYNKVSSLILLIPLCNYHFNPEFLLKNAPPHITEQSESFYLILFTGILRHREIHGVRIYLIDLIKQNKVGYKVFTFCISVEAYITKDSKNVGAISIAGIKHFSKNDLNVQQNRITNRENAYRIAKEGVKLLISMGDIQTAQLVTETYQQLKLQQKNILPITAEVSPLYLLTKYQILYEIGIEAIYPLLSQLSYQEIVQLLLNCYGIQEESLQKPEKVPEILQNFSSSLPQIKETHNICRNINLERFIKMLSEMRT
ncbi:hypothetical protein NEFER03_0737 [Nematocida sp. LUAm3]|nr:hypothetical protein NEFER03_0737 [Nematocida sp. LUAm3]KAI5175196.1 hypothetical protein NEFER02_1157 [Nematocida sp. LUAm2]KAI5178132.1 hypothetical protein NEFER01_1310 [Nematocida sp. LUAm1]